MAPTGTGWKALELHLGWNLWTDLQGFNMLSDGEGAGQACASGRPLAGPGFGAVPQEVNEGPRNSALTRAVSGQSLVIGF